MKTPIASCVRRLNILAESGSSIFLIWMGGVKLKSMMGMALLAAAASVLAWGGWALYRERYPSWYEVLRKKRHLKL